MAPFIKKILNANVRILLYYGDTDMACNFMMGQQFSAQLGLKVKRSGRSRDTLPHAPRFKRVINKQPWKFNRQIAGFKTIYSRGLTFITVRGAGRHSSNFLTTPLCPLIHFHLQGTWRPSGGEHAQFI